MPLHCIVSIVLKGEELGVGRTIPLKGNAKGHNDNGEKSNAYIRMLLKASDLAHPPE